MHEDRDEVAPTHYCFRCQGGCIHMVCGGAMLTLSVEQFLVLSEAVIALRVELRAELDRPLSEESPGRLIM